MVTWESWPPSASDDVGPALPEYGGLSQFAACRVMALWRFERAIGRPWCVDDAALACNVEMPLAGRFLREMVRGGWLERVDGPRPRLWYRVAQQWLAIALVITTSGRLPGRCCVCGADSVSFPFLRRFFCRDHLMLAHRDDYPTEVSS